MQTEADIGAATLTSASAYFERNSLATVDRTNEAGTDFFGGFGNPLGPAFPKSHLDAVAGVFGSHQFITSQEIRLASRDSSAALTWLVGAFYAHVRSRIQRHPFGYGSVDYGVVPRRDPHSCLAR